MEVVFSQPHTGTEGLLLASDLSLQPADNQPIRSNPGSELSLQAGQEQQQSYQPSSNSFGLLIASSQKLQARLQSVEAEKLDLQQKNISLQQHFVGLLRRAGLSPSPSALENQRSLESWVNQTARAREREQLEGELGIQQLNSGLTRLRMAFEAKLQDRLHRLIEQDCLKSKTKQAEAISCAQAKNSALPNPISTKQVSVKRPRRLAVHRCAGLALTHQTAKAQLESKPLATETPFVESDTAGLVAELREQLSRVESQLKSKASRLEALEKYHKSAQKSLAESSLKLNDSELKYQRASDRVTQLLGKIALFEIDTHKQQHQSDINSVLSADNQALKARIQSLELEVEAHKAMALEKQKQAEKLQERWQRSQSEIERKQQATSELEERVNSLREKLQTEHAKRASAAQANSKEQQKHLIEMQCLSNDLEDEKKNSSVLRADIARLQLQLQAVSVKFVSMIAQNQSLMQQVENAIGSVTLQQEQQQARQSEQSQKISEYENRLFSLQEELESFRRSDIQKERIIAELRVSAKETTQDQAQYDEKLERAIQMNQNIMRELSKHQQDLCRTNAQLEVLEGQKGKAQRMLMGVKQELQVITQLYEQAVAKAQQLQEEARLQCLKYDEDKDGYLRQLNEYSSLLEVSKRWGQQVEQEKKDLIALNDSRMHAVVEEFQQRLASSALENRKLGEQLQEASQSVILLEFGSKKMADQLLRVNVQKATKQTSTELQHRRDLEEQYPAEQDKTQSTATVGIEHQRVAQEVLEGTEPDIQRPIMAQDNTELPAEHIVEEMPNQSLAVQPDSITQPLVSDAFVQSAPPVVQVQESEPIDPTVEQSVNPDQVKGQDTPAQPSVSEQPSTDNKNAHGDVEEIQQGISSVEQTLPASLVEPPAPEQAPLPDVKEQAELKVDPQELIQNEPAQEQPQQVKPAEVETHIPYQNAVSHEGEPEAIPSLEQVAPLEPLAAETKAIVPPPFFAEQQSSLSKPKQQMPQEIDTEGILDKPELNLNFRTVKTVLKTKKKKVKVSKSILVDVIGEPSKEEPDE